jgi:hypothetical protein
MIQTASAIASEIGSYPRYESKEQFPPLLKIEAPKELPVSRAQREEAADASELVQINRAGKVRLFSFTDFFKGFENVEAVRSIFGPKTQEVLNNLKVDFFSFKFGYMAVSDDDGHLLVSTHHLRNIASNELYLDVIHELVHVKQFIDGRDLFNSKYEYADNPTEIGAYRHAVAEARRIGMTDWEIFEYLKVEWLSVDMHKKLVRAVGLKLQGQRC